MKSTMIALHLFTLQGKYSSSSVCQSKIHTLTVHRPICSSGPKSMLMALDIFILQGKLSSSRVCQSTTQCLPQLRNRRWWRWVCSLFRVSIEAQVSVHLKCIGSRFTAQCVARIWNRRWWRRWNLSFSKASSQAHVSVNLQRNDYRSYEIGDNGVGSVHSSG